MTSRNKAFGLLFLFLGLPFWGCNNSVVVDQFMEIPGRSWEYSHQPEIAIHIADPTVAYRMYVNFRHTAQYEYSNIFMLIHRNETGVPADTLAGNTRRIELTLAHPDGRWTGKQSGDIYTYQKLIADRYLFPDTGTYIFSLEQNMRENPLKAVVAAGLRFEVAN